MASGLHQGRGCGPCRGSSRGAQASGRWTDGTEGTQGKERLGGGSLGDAWPMWGSPCIPVAQSMLLSAGQGGSGGGWSPAGFQETSCCFPQHTPALPRPRGTLRTAAVTVRNQSSCSWYFISHARNTWWGSSGTAHVVFEGTFGLQGPEEEGEKIRRHPHAAPPLLGSSSAAGRFRVPFALWGVKG